MAEQKIALPKDACTRLSTVDHATCTWSEQVAEAVKGRFDAACAPGSTQVGEAGASCCTRRRYTPCPEKVHTVSNTWWFGDG